MTWTHRAPRLLRALALIFVGLAAPNAAAAQQDCGTIGPDSDFAHLAEIIACLSDRIAALETLAGTAAGSPPELVTNPFPTSPQMSGVNGRGNEVRLLRCVSAGANLTCDIEFVPASDARLEVVQSDIEVVFPDGSSDPRAETFVVGGEVSGGCCDRRNYYQGVAVPMSFMVQSQSQLTPGQVAPVVRILGVTFRGVTIQ